MRTTTLLPLAILLVTLYSCGSNETPNTPEPTEPQTKGVTFNSVVNEYNTQKLLVPDGAQVDILYQGAKDSVMTDAGVRRLSKASIDFLGYIPIDGSSDHGKLFMNHEMRDSNSVLGDGGGMSWVEVQKTNGTWQIAGDAHYIDFAPLGGTWHNCGGEVSPHSTILTAEEYPATSNAELYGKGNQIRDTSDFNGMKRNEALGWMVEVDVNTNKPLRKLVQLGRYSHEDAYTEPDGKTVYLTDDAAPNVFFKFVADVPNNLTKGQLYAYKQTEDGSSGSWIALPMDTQSLIHIREVALSMGATMFASHEWIDGIDGKIYISETGGGHDYTEWINKGANLAYHFRQPPLAQGNNVTQDYFGRILVFDPATNKMDVFMEGGQLPDGGYLNDPDGLVAVNINGQPYLVVCEDAWIGNMKEAKIESWEQGKIYLEVYMIPIIDGTADRTGVRRLTVGPEGCEQTGVAFTPDKKTMFLTVQHPDPNNPPPYNHTTVVAITGIFQN